MQDDCEMRNEVVECVEGLELWVEVGLKLGEGLWILPRATETHGSEVPPQCQQQKHGHVGQNANVMDLCQHKHNGINHGSELLLIRELLLAFLVTCLSQDLVHSQAIC